MLLPVYRFLLGLAYLLLLPVLPFWKKLRVGLRERLGLYTRKQRKKLSQLQGKALWVHAASAGDVLALSPLIRRLHQQNPALRFLLTVITDSGRLVALQQPELFDLVLQAPLEIKSCLRSLLKRLQPRLLLLEQTELWPLLLGEVSQRGVPVVLVNGRLSRRLFPWYRWLYRLMGPLPSCLSLALLRHHEDARRLLALGASPEAVHVTGNTKYDRPVTSPTEKLRAALTSWGWKPDQLLFVAGSVHEAEEEKVLAAFQETRSHFPALSLLLAPRYLSRLSPLQHRLQKMGLSSSLRSAPQRESAVLLLDTLGELSSVYSFATVAFVGGSLCPHGGHNCLEPASWGIPLLVGPYVHHFHHEVQELQQKGALQRVVDVPTLVEGLLFWLGQPHRRWQASRAARQVYQQFQGATARVLSLLAPLLPPTTEQTKEEEAT